jgi:hypothetical protein
MLWAKGESWYVVELIITVFLLLDWDYGWTGQHPPVGGSELESETYRGRGAGTSTFRSTIG